MYLYDENALVLWMRQDSTSMELPLSTVASFCLIYLFFCALQSIAFICIQGQNNNDTSC